eukprot:4863583-Amphidinium_carterae.1
MQEGLCDDDDDGDDDDDDDDDEQERQPAPAAAAKRAKGRIQAGRKLMHSLTGIAPRSELLT